MFQAGGNFVLYKPLDLMQVLHSFRAAQAFMQKDRRRASRQRSETLAYLQLPGGTIPALVQDVTEQGLSLQAAEPLMPLRGVPLRFLLPGTTNVVACDGRLYLGRQGRPRWVVLHGSFSGLAPRSASAGSVNDMRESQIPSACCSSHRRHAAQRQEHTEPGARKPKLEPSDAGFEPRTPKPEPSRPETPEARSPNPEPRSLFFC